MQSALFVPRIILSYVAYLSVPYFYTPFHKRQDFLKKFEHNVRLDFLDFLYKCCPKRSSF